MPIEYILGVRNAIKALEGEARYFKLARIWHSATPDQKAALLKEFPGLFSEFQMKDEKRAHEAVANGRFRMWLRRHPAFRRLMFGFLCLCAPYLLLSKTQRWIFSVGQYKAEEAPYP